MDLDQLHSFILQHGGARTLWWNVLLVEPLMHGLSFVASLLPQPIAGGLAIIIFTLLIRVVLLPLTLQQVKSQKAMQALQPEIKALQKKYGDDREKVSAETMRLYKEHGVNPAASCLPLALQMPVLFALYAAMRNLGSDPNYGQVAAFHTDPFRQGWLWLENLNAPDVIHIPGLSFPIPFILPILAGVTQWVQQRMMTPPTDDPQQKMQNSMMQFMPLMMLYFGVSFASGLALYWVTQNVFGIVQQYFSTGWGSLIPSRFTALAAPSDGRAPRPSGTARLTPSDVPENGKLVARDGGARGPSPRSGGGGGRARREGRRASGKR